ncbi:unnamed protein product [Mesocestoides corti]|uniref:UNC-45/Cro1/She4 central domain-containing protein n=1 Tax=Mesocestoides corti TaxID=53468 RepID=A0A0R3UE20_MESCO|nr:unnamed protein product [Mesocestoides corti]
MEKKEKGGSKGSIDKTYINKSSACQSGASRNEDSTTCPNTNGSGPEYMSVEAFKAQVSADAAERSKLRAKRRAKADEFKLQANEFFKVGDWESALNLYSKAIDACRDMPVLYTNRAQAYLKLGRPEQALADCDLALRILPMEPKTTPTDIGDDAEAACALNQQAAKACLHRGKALLTLRRPCDALRAYVDARAFRAFALKPASAVMPDPDSDDWPPFLREYVAQAKAAIAAENLDSQASAKLSSPSSTEPLLLKPTEERFLRLITEAALDDRGIRECTSTLRQMASLLSAANVVAKLPPSPDSEQGEDGTHEGHEATDGVIAPTGDHPKGSSKEHKKKKENGTTLKTSISLPVNEADTTATIDEVATLAKLQSYFRVRNGFKVLRSQMKLYDAPNILKQFRRRGGYAAKSTPDAQKGEDVLAILDHLLSLITVCYQLARDCGENQRLLVESMPQLFSTLLIDCLQVSPCYAQIPTSLSDTSENAAMQEVRFRHVLGLLQCSACDLIALMSFEASGREGLITHPGPAVLLSALATCLSDALGLPVSRATTNRKATSSTQQRPSSDCFATQAVAATAKILENLTESPRFIVSVRLTFHGCKPLSASLQDPGDYFTRVQIGHLKCFMRYNNSMVRSSDCFASLQDVIEAAIAPASSGSATTSAPVACLSQLLDSLSAASDDPVLRHTMITKPNFLINLTNCALRHVPLMIDESHTALVGSLCRLLHNFLTGEQQVPLARCEMEALLNLVGSILDQPSRSSALISVSIALLGKFMPLCAADLVDKWSHTGKDATKPFSKKAQPSQPKLKERVSILISIISSYSASVLEEAPSPPIALCGSRNDTQTTNGKSQYAANVYESSESLAAHRLRGAIRALSAITRAPGCGDVRVAIGDSRLISRRLAQLIRARAPHAAEADARSPPARDEPLTANVCLILEACIEDTVMAENLVGTSIIMDLLKLIQESKKPQTKRNAACVIGRLASASHVHREEVSRLNGMSVLSHFNSWTAQVGATQHAPGMLF